MFYEREQCHVGRSRSRGHCMGVIEVGEAGDEGAVRILAVTPPR
jgi:hypothetical protein